MVNLRALQPNHKIYKYLQKQHYTDTKWFLSWSFLSDWDTYYRIVQALCTAPLHPYRPNCKHRLSPKPHFRGCRPPPFQRGYLSHSHHHSPALTAYHHKHHLKAIDRISFWTRTVIVQLHAHISNHFSYLQCTVHHMIYYAPSNIYKTKNNSNKM